MTLSADHMTVKNIVAIILGVIGVIWVVSGVWRNWKIRSISKWPKTNATVINSLAEPANSSAGNTFIDPRYIVATTDSNAKFIPRVVYRYRVGNREFQSENVVYFGPRYYSAADIKMMLGQIYPGAVIPVFYNPNNNSESYIYNGNKSYTGIVIGIILILISSYLGYYHVTEVSKNIKTANKDALASPSLTDIDDSITKKQSRS